MIVLGLTGGFHPGSCDAAASLVRDGVLLASVEEERLTRVKYSFGVPPARCIRSVLEVSGLSIHDVDVVAIYVETYPDAVREMRTHIEALYGHCPPITCVNHHLCHAASAYYASGFDDAAVLTLDWSGDGISTSLWTGTGTELEQLEVIPRPNSLGMFYAGFTQFLGFDRGDEYKVMGLAAYGEPSYDLSDVLDTSDEIYRLNEEVYDPRTRSMHQLIMSDLLRKSKPGLARTKWAPVTHEHRDFAASVQHQFEQAVFNLVRRLTRISGRRRLCIAGGGGLNCTANGKIVAQKLADEVYVPSFPNDSGCSFGAAASVMAAEGFKIAPVFNSQLGPGFSNEQIEEDVGLLKCAAQYEPNVEEVVADAIVAGDLVGWFQGGMEVGPRALGGRSILADPRDPTVKDRINKYVKFRETFRPFAPSVLESASRRYFDFPQTSPFMSFTANVLVPDELPGITHVDGTARLQTVMDDHGRYARLLHALGERTGYEVVLNTSFNYMGQPIVCTPKEAIYTFFGTGLDALALGNWILRK